MEKWLPHVPSLLLLTEKGVGWYEEINGLDSPAELLVMTMCVTDVLVCPGDHSLLCARGSRTSGNSFSHLTGFY